MKYDNNIKIKYFSCVEFFSIFLVLMVLSSLPAIMYGRPLKDAIFNDYTVWYILYWLLVTTIIWGITVYQKYKTFSRPLKILSRASKAVSQGDFSVYIEPLHTSDKKDYMDILFEDFNNMVRELGSIETLKNDFISNVSHELKTPLAVIQNYTTMLKSNTLPEEQRQEYLNTVIEATHKLTNLITNILRLNKLENQEILPPTASYDLCRQLCDCVLSFETILESKNIELDVDIEDKAIINTDEELLEIVWNNLLSNAVKFTNESGKVNIKQTSENDVIIVEITDTGCGMSEETMKHIFDKFYQGDTSHSGDGNGLGLALVYRIIDKIGGTISVTSKLGVGTTFYVRINTNKKIKH